MISIGTEAQPKLVPVSHVQPNGPGSQRTPPQSGPHEPWPLHALGQPVGSAWEQVGPVKPVRQRHAQLGVLLSSVRGIYLALYVIYDGAFIIIFILFGS